jgi:hypothetical protein
MDLGTIIERITNALFKGITWIIAREYEWRRNRTAPYYHPPKPDLMKDEPRHIEMHEQIGRYGDEERMK